MKNMMLVVVFAVAAMIAGNAAAQELDDTLESEAPYYIAEDGSIDWELVKEWSEIVDTFVDDEGVERNLYLDFFNELMWDEPSQASITLGEGDRTYYIVPTIMRWYYEGGGSNEWTSGDFTYVGSCGRNCRKWMNNNGSCPKDVDMIYARGGTPYTADYCDGDYYGQYHRYTTWYNAQTDNCGSGWLHYWYELSENTGLEWYDYSPVSYPRMAAFKYKISGSSQRTEIWCNDVPE